MASPAQPVPVSPSRLRLSGWPIVAWATFAVIDLASAAFAVAGGGEAGWRALVRTTAKTSLLFFSAAFVASSLRVLWRTPFTAWLLANRRYIGVSFAASHALHLLGIIALLISVPDFELNTPTLIGGGLAYVLLAAMTATSFDRSAAWLGPKRWKRLHKTGMYYNWFIFFISYLPRVLVTSLWYAPFVIVLVGSIALRAVAWARQR